MIKEPTPIAATLSDSALLKPILSPRLPLMLADRLQD